MRYIPVRALCVLVCCVFAENEEPFQVAPVLRAAVETLGEVIDKAAVMNDEAKLITVTCVPDHLGITWKSSFDTAVETMLQKTKRSMQRGLAGVAQSMIDLLAGTTCGNITAFERFAEQASRLHVLATFRSLAGLDSKVLYEPLKALTVGDIDIHEELNALIIAWQFKSPPEKLGKVLMDFFNKFSTDTEDNRESQAPSGTLDTPAGDAPGKRMPSFWVSAVNHAFSKLGDDSMPVKPECLGEEAVQRHGEDLDAAFRSMMEKTRRGIQMGLKMLSRDMLGFLDSMEAKCDTLKVASGAKRLRDAASRLSVLAGTKNLVNFGVHVEYEAMKELRVGGVDVHLELNLYIGAWLNNQGATDMGEAIAKFFQDFKEEEEEADEKDNAASESTDPLFIMLRDAFLAAQEDRVEALDLPPTCFPEAVTKVFVQDINNAIDHMLQKRKRSMQQGLKEFADATDRLLKSLETQCIWSTGAKSIWLGAKKLQKLSRRTVVDYGKYIKYEAMKSLQIGNVPVHLELNNFLAAWKFRSQEESGKPFGMLLKKLSTIDGHDEL